MKALKHCLISDTFNLPMNNYSFLNFGLLINLRNRKELVLLHKILNYQLLNKIEHLELVRLTLILLNKKKYLNCFYRRHLHLDLLPNKRVEHKLL